MYSPIRKPLSMGKLFSKDEDINSSPPIFGYKILQLMNKKKTKRISLFDVSDNFQNEKWFNPRNLFFAMMFLYSLDLIKFEQPYIVLKDEN